MEVRISRSINVFEIKKVQTSSLEIQESTKMDRWNYVTTANRVPETSGEEESRG